MLRSSLNRLAPFVALAFVGCTPSSGGNGVAGSTGNAGGTSGSAGGTTGTGGATGVAGATGTAGTGGTGTAGVTGTAGAAGAGVAGTGGGGATGSAGGGGAGADGGGTTGAAGGPACAAFTQVNQAAVSLKRMDLSAYKFAPTPAANVMKMDYDPLNMVVVMETQGAKFYKFDPKAALPTGTATATTATQTEMNYPYGGDHRGLAFAPDGTMYTLASAGTTGGNGVNIYKGVPAAGGGHTWSQIAKSAGYPLPQKGGNFGHSFSGLALDPSGQYLYFSSGSRSDHGEMEETARELPLTSAIFRVPTTPAGGGMTMLPADDAGLAPYLFADGTRNSFDPEFNANGDLIAGDNGPDMDLPDEINWIQMGKHYGFPWRFGAEDNPVRAAAYTAAGDMRLHTGYQAVGIMSYFYDAGFPAAPAGVTFVDPIMNMGPDENFFRTGPMGLPTQGAMPGITGHRSPLGLSFDTKGALCGAYYKQGFIASYGSLPQSGFADQGQDLALLTLNKGAGTYTSNVQIIATGLKSPMDTVLVGNRLFLVGISTAAPVYAFVFPTP